jgi:hypothetical protein
MYSLEIILWIFLLRQCPFKKCKFMSIFLGKSSETQKVGPMGQPPWELDSMFFLYLASRALTAPTEIDLPYLCLPRGEGQYLCTVRKSAQP